MTVRITTLIRASFCGVLLLATALADDPNLQNSGLHFQQIISVPNWGKTAANTDLFGFNPVTRMMYLADRTNHAVDVIDTHTNTVIGQIALAANTVVNQPLVAIDLQQLVVSDGIKSVLVWNLVSPVPNGAPDVYPMPSTTPDGMDYDTINQIVYVVTDDAPYTLVGISLTQKKIVTQKQIPFSPDLIKFNSIDGKLYIAMEDGDHDNASAGIAVYDPATDTMSAPAMYKVGPICPGHGIDIDPITNVALMGCFGGTSNGNLAMDLATGNSMTFPDVGGTDSIVLNPNLRRFYTGSGLNKATTSGCPATPPGFFGVLVPVVGVFDAIHTSTAAPARLDGVACTGRGNHIAGVDSIRNNVLVPVAQYPADPTSTTSGTTGIVVFHDSTHPAQEPIDSAQADLTPVSGGVVSATVQTNVDKFNRRTRVTSTIPGITGAAAWLTIPTTVAIEVVHCPVDAKTSTASCDDFLLGDPLVGSTITLSIDGIAAARGPVRSCGDDDHGNGRNSCRSKNDDDN